MHGMATGPAVCAHIESWRMRSARMSRCA